MSERANASVIPFKVDEEAEEGAVAQGSDENRPRTPPNGCTWPKPCAWPRRSSSPAPSRSAKSSFPRACPTGINVAAAMADLQQIYARRGVNLVRVGDAWAFRTAGDLAFLMSRDAVQQKKLSRAALEVLAIIAYHQPVTRAEIEDIRGVETSKGTLDTLMETEWVRMRGRRRTPGRPGHLRHHRHVPRSFRAGGNPRPSRHGGVEGRRAAFGAHAVEFLRAVAAGRSRRARR